MRLRSVFPLLAAVLLTGCSVPAFMSFAPQVRGNRVDLDEMKQLVPGTSTRADATAALGSPTAKATFDDNTWIYIGEVTKPVIGGTLDVLDQQVVLLSFDQGGVLRNIEHKTQDDSKPVGMVAGATPSPGSDATLLQQLLGNIGKFTSLSPTGGGNAVGPSGAGSTTGTTTGNGP